MQLFLTLAGVTLLFTQAQLNGTLDRVAHARRAPLPRQRRAHPGDVLRARIASSRRSVPGTSPRPRMLAPMAMAVAARAAIPPFLMAIMVGNGAQSGALSPVAPTGIIVTGLMDKIGLGGYELADLRDQPRRARHRRVRRVLAARRLASVPASIRAAARATPRHRVRTAPLDHARVSSAPCSSPCCSSTPTSAWRRLPAPCPGGAASGRSRAGDPQDAVDPDPDGQRRQRARRAAREDRRARSVHGAPRAIRHAGTLTGVIAFVTGIISVYSSTSGVVLPAFLPTVPGLIERLGGDPFSIASSMNIGAHLVDMSPLSTTGAMCIAGISDRAGPADLQQAARLGAVDDRDRRDRLLPRLLTGS